MRRGHDRSLRSGWAERLNLLTLRTRQARGRFVGRWGTWFELCASGQDALTGGGQRGR